MHFRIADTFTDSLAKLTGDEQKAVKITAYDLQTNPAQPGLNFHKLDRARDPNFWSVRVSRDIRIIVHRTRDSLLLCYVDHHDDAYQWAERRKLETHPRTGAAQLVEVRQTVQEITVPKYMEAEQEVLPKPLLFEDLTDSDLLDYGVPAEWLDDVRNANEDGLLELAEHLPGEAAEALLELAVGVTPQAAQPVGVSEDPVRYTEKISKARVQPVVAHDPFEHPDAKRRFRVMHDVAELERALDYPWEKWAVFLHPAQQQVVEKDFGGPSRVSGSAGTGKTVVAIHRAAFLARANPDARVLLTTFSDTLANALRTKLRRLIHNEPRLAERVEIDALDTVGERLYRAQFGSPKIATREEVQEFLAKAADQEETSSFSLRFLLSEWENVVDAWQLDSWDAYRDIRRLGRKTRLPVERRAALWSVFEQVKADLQDRGLVTRAGMFGLLAGKLKDRRNPPFDFAIVDEAQDISVAQLRFLAALGDQRPNSLFFAGDLGQRIFQTPFSWKALGVDVRGDRRPSSSTIERPTRSERRRTVCWVPKSLMSMATSRIGGERSRRSTATRRRYASSRPSRKKARPWERGCRNGATKVWMLARWGYSCGRRRSWTERARRFATPDFLFRSWMNEVRRARTAYPSARCIWRKDWSSAPSRSWRVTMRRFRYRNGSKP